MNHREETWRNFAMATPKVKNVVSEHYIPAFISL